MGPGPTAGSLVPDDTNGSGVDGGKHLDVGDMSDVSSAVPAVAAEAKKRPKVCSPPHKCDRLRFRSLFSNRFVCYLVSLQDVSGACTTLISSAHQL